MAVTRYALAAILGSVLLAAPVAAQTSTGIVTGRVLDSASRQPLAAVSVRIDGLGLGALSRTDGAFTIVGVPAGAQTVRASRIGFGARTQSVAVPNGGTVSVELAMSTRAAVLTEMVVTGYGTQRREAITGSVSTVQADEANVGVVTNANQLLQARVPGVQMVTNNGEPGGGAQIRIRGGTSISASNDPLYVVDGVPLQNESGVAGAGIRGVNSALGRSPLNSINPSDIETITVLKDASATAIYGSRGANGVVLIQTKKGVRGGSAMDYDAYVSASQMSSKLDFMSGDEYRSFVADQIKAGKLPATQTALLGKANTNWEDALSQTGYSNNHNLSFSGGSTQTLFRASLNYFDQKGVVIANGLKRYQGRLNAQHTALGGKLNMDLNMTASRVNNTYLASENGGGFVGGVFTNMAFFNPTQPVMVADSATGTMNFYEIGRGAQDLRNPVALARQITDFAPENRVLGNLTATLSVMQGLVATTTLGTDYTNSVRKSYVPRVSPLGADLNGIARQAERSLQNLNFQQLLTATPKLSARSELEVVGGYEYSRFDNQGFEAVQQGFITDAFQAYNLAAATTAGGGSPLSYIQQSRLVSFFARANFGFADKYFLTGVVRRDGSSRLAEGNKWAVFPAISASWRISNEEFMKDGMFSSLAVRTGFGRQGNQAIAPYATQLLLRTDNGAKYPFGTGVTTGLSASQVENTTLKWETSEQTNVGVDWGIQNDRITGVFDLYQKTTKDLLLTVPVPQPAVVAQQLQNIGSVQNRGFEAAIDARLIDQPTRSFSSGLVFSVERNKVQNLGPDRQFIITGNVFGQGQSGRSAQRIIVDEPLGTFWGATFLRVDNAGKQVFRCESKSVGCVNGETFSPTSGDEGIIGNANSKFSLGLRSAGTMSGIDVSWLWRGEFGRNVFNNTELVYGTKGNAKSNKNFLRSALSDPVGIDEPAIFSSRYIENGRFVRLQNATVGYTFKLPAAIGGGRSTRVYVSGDNLLLFTPYKGYDPEVFTGAGVAARGIDYLTYPRARTFTTGAHISF